MSVGIRLTATRNVHAAAVFLASVAWQATVVTPSGKVEPENGEQVTVTGATDTEVEAARHDPALAGVTVAALDVRDDSAVAARIGRARLIDNVLIGT